MIKIEYSQIVRHKLKELKIHLTREFGAEISRKAIKSIINTVRVLEIFPLRGISVSDMYDVECDYRYVYANHNYLFYRIENDKIIIVEMFDNREDFMFKLFGITTITQESIDYWNE